MHVSFYKLWLSDVYDCMQRNTSSRLCASLWVMVEKHPYFSALLSNLMDCYEKEKLLHWRNTTGKFSTTLGNADL